MGSIADLFARLRVDDAGFEADVTKKVGKAGDKAGQSFGKRLGAGLKSSGSGIADGLKIGAGIKAFGALDSAISGTIGLLGDASAAFKEDQQSQSQLREALQANVAGFDGNTAAIEATLLARERLGFSDDEQRKSLATLVARTHDSTKALDLQRMAMDLARFRGIDLAAASDLVGKAYNGQVGALRKAGIAVDAHATAEEALLAVSKAVSGQAEAYANTDAGKEIAANLKVGESMERIGEVVSKVATVALPILADAFTFIIDVVANVIKGVQDLLGPLAAVNDFVGSLPGPWHHTADAVEEAAAKVAASTKHMSEHVKDDAAAIKSDGRDIGGYIQLIGGKAKSAEEQVAAAMTDIVSDVQGARSQLGSAAQGAADAIYDPIIAGAERARIARDVAEQQQIIDSKNSTAAQVADAKARMLELRKSQITNLATLASYGDQSAAAALKHQIDVLASTKHLTIEQKAELAALRAALRLTQTAYHNTEDAARRLAYMSSHTKDDTALPTTGHRAQGGPIWPGTWEVGEAGRERLTIGANGRGYVTPLGGRIPSMAMAGYSGASAVAAPASRSFGGDTTTVNVAGYIPERSPREIVTELRRSQNLRSLPRRRRPVTVKT